MPASVIGIDLGCTNIKGVLVDEEGNILEELQCQTNEKEERQWKAAVAEIVHALSKKTNGVPVPVGLSAPGLASGNNDCIVLMPDRLAGLEKFIWTDFLGMPTYVLNDAHAALMAEARFGAAKGYQNVVLLTLGTGVGGGLLIRGELQQGLLQRAGHFGHVSLDADSDDADVTNMPASLENAIGDLTVRTRSFGKYASTAELVEGYRKGEPIAQYVWLHSVKKLAVGLCSFINIISPELIVIGGGISRAGEDLFFPLKEFMAIFEWQHSGVRTPVVSARYSEFSGAIGAAGFALQKSSLK
jgi:glucokinase